MDAFHAAQKGAGSGPLPPGCWILLMLAGGALTAVAAFLAWGRPADASECWAYLFASHGWDWQAVRPHFHAALGDAACRAYLEALP